MAVFLTLNAYLLDVRLFGRVRVYKAAPWIEPRRRALLQALRESDADVVCLQEVFRRPHRADLAGGLKDLFPHAAGIRHPGLPLGTGLMVLSRHPILAARPREFRAAFFEERLAIRMGLLECLIDLPSLGPTRVIDFHLCAGGLKHHPEAPPAEAVRTAQIAELLAVAHGPGAAAVVLAGDLNSGPHTSPANYRQVLAGGFRDALAEPGEDAFTWDPANPMITGELNRSLPPQRIDHVFLRGPARACEAGLALHEPRADLSDGRCVPVSDHYGLRVRIEPA
ncbi:MAG: endonuclease/exonuclease/phosphatase family protein [Magnetospirillum sp. WYHS-4]